MIEKIFDENIDTDLKDITMIENVSTTETIKEGKSNDSFSVTNTDTPSDKDLGQDIEVNELEVREEITISASDDFNFETPSEALIVLITESQDTTHIPNDMIDKNLSKVESKKYESLQDVHIKLSKPLFNSENKGNAVLDIFAISKVEESDEIEDNDNLIPCTKEIIGSIETNDTLYTVPSVQDFDIL